VFSSEIFVTRMKLARHGERLAAQLG